MYNPDLGYHVGCSEDVVDPVVDHGDLMAIALSKLEAMRNNLNEKIGIMDTYERMQTIIVNKMHETRNDLDIKDPQDDYVDNTDLRSQCEQQLQLLNQEKKELEEKMNTLVHEIDNMLKIFIIDFHTFSEVVKNVHLPVSINYQSALEGLEKDVAIYNQIRLFGWRLHVFDDKNLAPDLMKMEHYGEGQDDYLYGILGPLTGYVQKPVSDSSSSSSRDQSTKKGSLITSQISTEEVRYLKQTVGVPLSLGLTEIIMKHPRDPIHYLGHFLFKYRYVQEMGKTEHEYFSYLNHRNLNRRTKHEDGSIIDSVIGGGGGGGAAVVATAGGTTSVPGMNQENEHTVEGYKEVLKDVHNMVLNVIKTVENENESPTVV